MKKCLIIAALNTENLKKLITKDTFIIAVDRGYQNAINQNIIPDLILGDWDSMQMPITRIHTIKLPKEKDDTDTMYAAKWAKQNGFTNVVIAGTIGNRIDHTYANIQTLYFLQKNGIQANLYSDDTVIYMLCSGQTISIKPMQDNVFSVFSYSEKVDGVNIDNAKYRLKNACINNDFPIGTSNEFLKTDVKISIKNGVLLVIVTKKD